MKHEIEKIATKAKNRTNLWASFIQQNNCNSIAEIGVYKGIFAEDMLKRNNFIEKYFLIDPWRNLADWNKPANKNNTVFEKIYTEAVQRTDFAKNKRIILRGKTTEIIDEIEEKSLDFVYVDGDHTLKGITIDLINIWPKLKKSGFIAGDDFSPTIWQHTKDFEPTMVFPFAIYFAEAMDVKIFGLPFEQFLIVKEAKGFEFIDLAGDYQQTDIRHQLTGKTTENQKQKTSFLKRLFQ